MNKVNIYPISGNDIEQVVTLWNKLLPVDAITVNTFIAKVILDENFEQSNVLVVKDNNKIVGFIVGAFTKTNIYKDVDPDNIRCWITALALEKEYHKRGIGLLMVNTLLEQFKLKGKKECYIATYPFGYFTPGLDVKIYSGAIEFFKHLGFSEKYKPLSMDSNIVLLDFSKEYDVKLKELEKEGIYIKTFDVKYIISYLDYMKSMTSDWLRVARYNLTDMTKNHFSPEQITIAVKGEKVVGYCQFEGSHFGPFGVSNECQGKGIGTILLGKTLERMKMHGYHDAWVVWTDDLAAKVYSKFGFKETRRFSVLFKQL